MKMETLLSTDCRFPGVIPGKLLAFELNGRLDIYSASLYEQAVMVGYSFCSLVYVGLCRL